MSRDISRIMRKVRSRDTAPELAFRKALWSKGLRYRVCPANLPGKPDVVIPSKRLAIFIDGDFWHGGQYKRRRLDCIEEQFRETPSKDYWLNKIRRNMERDCAATACLLHEGWRVLRFWESAVKNRLDDCIQMTLRVAEKETKADSFGYLPQKTFAEFFAGIGLIRFALERHGWTMAYANDIDPQKHEVYKEHFKDADDHYHLIDIHETHPASIPAVTLATASFPCNDLSVAGARKGLRGKQSSAFWGFVKILKGMKDRKPPIVLLENVTGFLTSAKGQDFRDALAAMNDLGYAVDAFILDASRFVPQSRQRLFVVGGLNPSDGELSLAQEAARLHESDVRPKMLADFIYHHSEIRWNIRNLPAQPFQRSSLEEVIEDHPPESPLWWQPSRAEYLLNQMSQRHRAQAEKMISGSQWSYGTVFRRIRKSKSMAELRTDGIAGCLRTPRGGSARQILFKAGKGKYFVRFMTPRECAHLMGAGEYNIQASFNQALFGFGDAVCVPVIEWIAQHYLNPLVSEMLRGRPLYFGS